MSGRLSDRRLASMLLDAALKTHQPAKRATGMEQRGSFRTFLVDVHRWMGSKYNY